MKIVATICSRKKDPNTDLLSARLRYLGEHVGRVSAIAADTNTPFYILSGKYGLISADEKIPDYDYLLTEDAVEELSEMIAQQIREAGITEIAFYSESNPNWKPYEKAAQQGAQRGDAELVMHQL